MRIFKLIKIDASEDASTRAQQGAYFCKCRSPLLLCPCFLIHSHLIPLLISHYLSKCSSDVRFLHFIIYRPQRQLFPTKMRLRERSVVLTILVLCSSTLFYTNGVSRQHQSGFAAPSKQFLAHEESLRERHSCLSRYYKFDRHQSEGGDSKSENACARLLHEEHRVGPLPWAPGQEQIVDSFAGHFPIRSWQQDGYHGETNMYETKHHSHGSRSNCAAWEKNPPLTAKFCRRG